MLLGLNIIRAYTLKPQLWSNPFLLFNHKFWSQNHCHFENVCEIRFTHKNKILLPVVDHSARWSRKNAASCVNRCEMQDTPSTRHSNAHCSLGTSLGFVCLSVVYKVNLHQKTWNMLIILFGYQFDRFQFMAQFLLDNIHSRSTREHSRSQFVVIRCFMRNSLRSRTFGITRQLFK